MTFQEAEDLSLLLRIPDFDLHTVFEINYVATRDRDLLELLLAGLVLQVEVLNH